MKTKPQGKQQCCATVKSKGAWTGHKCGNAASIDRDGYGYCKIHDPVAIAEKRTKRDIEFTDRFAADLIRRNALIDRNNLVHACHDNLVNALAGLLEVAERCGLEKYAAFDLAKKTLARARSPLAQSEDKK